MARKRPGDRSIFFPWERRRSLLSGMARAKPLGAAVGMAAVLLAFGVKERDAAGVRSTRATLTVVGKAVDAWRADHELACPPSLSVLKENGYLASDPVDAWGRPLRLLCPGFAHPRGYDLMSDGPDGVLGGLDRVE
jgi:general secretion pathway protein G